MITKQELRREIRKQKALHTPGELREMSLLLCRHVLENPQWQKAKVVLLYHALPDEVDTSLLLQEGTRNGKTILLPVVEGDHLLLRLFSNEMITGAFGIQEPQGEDYMEWDRIELAVIPGMAFDKKGNRLGRGKGYYDRLLSQLRAYRLGLCFPFQSLPSIPADEHDIVMDEVISKV